jgi:hypothetical protein
MPTTALHGSKFENGCESRDRKACPTNFVAVLLTDDDVVRITTENTEHTLEFLKASYRSYRNKTDSHLLQRDV